MENPNPNLQDLNPDQLKEYLESLSSEEAEQIHRNKEFWHRYLEKWFRNYMINENNPFDTYINLMIRIGEEPSLVYTYGTRELIRHFDEVHYLYLAKTLKPKKRRRLILARQQHRKNLNIGSRLVLLLELSPHQIISQCVGPLSSICGENNHLFWRRYFAKWIGVFVEDIDIGEGYIPTLKKIGIKIDKNPGSVMEYTDKYINWVINNSYFNVEILIQDYFVGAARYGKIKWLEHLIKYDSTFETQSEPPMNVTENDLFGISEWLEYSDKKDSKIRILNEAFLGAAENNQLEVLQWFENYFQRIQHRPSDGTLNDAFKYAVKHNQQEVLQWLENYFQRLQYIPNIRVLNYTFVITALNGQLEVLQWLENYFKRIQHLPDAKDMRSAFRNASKNGNLEVLQWLKGYFQRTYHQLPNDIIIHNAFESAAQHGQLEVLKWLKNHFHLRNNIGIYFIAAVRSGKLEVLKWLIKISEGNLDIHDANDKAFRNAFKYGYLHIAEYIKSLHPTYDWDSVEINN